LKKLIYFSVFIILTINLPYFAQDNELPKSTSLDSLELIKEYSLFSEYHKNKDYKSAEPYGWNVLRNDLVKFNKWIYFKMEDIMWYLHDSTNISDVEKKVIADTTIYLYDLAKQYYPDQKGYFQLKKAYVQEVWRNVPPEVAIAEYEEALKLDSTASSYYYNRLGQLYKNNINDNNDYEEKAIDLYSYLSEIEPDNPAWTAELESLVDDISKLVDIAKRNWDFDKNNLEKAWKYVATCIRANENQKAIEGLEFLVQKSPNTINYWQQLASLYHKTDQIDKAIDAYKKLIELDPNTKEHYLNLGLAYRDKGLLSTARTQFQKAFELDRNWALPIFYEGLLYETAARNCGFEFMDKCVYQLAVDTYRRAASIDPNFNQARERISALSNSVPTKEDYFFRQLKSGTSIRIEGKCYDWIGRSITVP